MSEEKIFPVITLYQPWATWIMRGWKLIETRTHDRFKSLIHKTVLIHAGQKFDEDAFHNPFLTTEQRVVNVGDFPSGAILGSAYVEDFDIVQPHESKDALIDCETVKRYGLYLSYVHCFEKPIPAKGEMGIWYYDMANKNKVHKPKHAKQLSIL